MSTPEPLQGPAPLPPTTGGKRRGAGFWIAVGAGVVALVAACAGAVAWWGWDAFTDQARSAMAVHPTVIEHIGTIREMDVDWTATGAEPDDDTFAFHLYGYHGSGMVIARFVTVDSDHERIDSGTLTMDNGPRVSLAPQDDGDVLDMDEDGQEDAE